MKLDAKYWPQWSAMLGNIRKESPEFLIDLGDTWAFNNGYGVPHSPYFPVSYGMVMKPARSGVDRYRGLSDVCADCGYFMVRGNHEGISAYDHPSIREYQIALVKLFAPNPNGATYPQGGSLDPDYDEGYFASEWGDALFVVLDVVKYKDSKQVNNSASRFHIGEEQLSWLTSVLENSTHKWKLIFAHHLFGGGSAYGRGGATCALQNEQAQIQALAETHGAHFFHGHDHLLSAEYASSVFYYCAGLACGQLLDYKNWADRAYPSGYVLPSTDSSPIKDLGYVIVDATPSTLTITYKTYLGAVVQIDRLTNQGPL